MTADFYGYYESPIGTVEIGGSTDAITWLYFVERYRADVTSCPLVEQAVEQVAAYFMDGRTTFDLPLDLHGTDFQRQVWQQLLTIDYGQTVSYQSIADALGNPQVVRAVGAANGQNPISIIVPCHRVIGSNGQLTGYGGGLWRKEWLLKHEGALLL
jgi:methylated-DNA-[protein]-cysteine S-methyltransferase